MPSINMELTDDDLKKLKEEASFLEEENLGVGLGETLKRLRENGLLEDSNFDYSGRNLDEKPYEERIKDSNNEL